MVESECCASGSCEVCNPSAHEQLLREARSTTEIRATHPYAFRSGQWATLLRRERHPETGRDCYVVRFPDGAKDWWVVADQDEHYEFRQAEALVI